MERKPIPDRPPIPEPFARFVCRMVARARRRIAAEEAARQAEVVPPSEAPAEVPGGSQ